jgi:arylformamidase
MSNGATPAAIYRGMDRAALDAAYNNTEAVRDSADFRDRWERRSDAIRAGKGAWLDLPYGERPRAKLDYFPCGKEKPPLFVFIHGGYWQRNDKEMFAFVSDGPRPHGIDVAAVGYTLAPQARLTDIVGEVWQALTVLSERADEFGFDGERLFVGGWSAGGHLTAIVSQHPAFRGGLPISGIFDLEPIALNYLNEKLRLDPAEIAGLSPLNVLAERMPPLRMFVGGAELPELRRDHPRAGGDDRRVTVVPAKAGTQYPRNRRRKTASLRVRRQDTNSAGSLVHGLLDARFRGHDSGESCERP